MLDLGISSRVAAAAPRRVHRLLACALAFSCAAVLTMADRGSGQGAEVPSWQRIDGAPVDLKASEVASAWTGRRLVVLGQPWGGGQAVAASYDPRSRRWRTLSPPASIDVYPGSSAIWTGRRVVVMNPQRSLVYDPGLDRFKQLARGHGGFVEWTGRELLAWGGGCCADYRNDGIAYDPASDRWRKLARSPLAGSQGPVGAWTGRELLVFVGDRIPDTGERWPARLARAAAYDPATNRWRRIARMPEERWGASVAWDGRELLVVGGRSGRRCAPTASRLTRRPTAGGGSLPCRPRARVRRRSGPASGSCSSAEASAPVARRARRSPTTPPPTAGPPCRPRRSGSRERLGHLDRARRPRLGRVDGAQSQPPRRRDPPCDAVTGRGARGGYGASCPMPPRARPCASRRPPRSRPSRRP